MRWPGLVVAVVATTTDVIYLGYVDRQGGSDPQFLTVPFVASFIALMAISAAISTRATAARWRPLLLGSAAGGLLLLGFFAMFSIGQPLLIGGFVALVGAIGSIGGTAPAPQATRTPARIGMAVGGGIASVIVLLVGFSVVEVNIKCPATGSESGGGLSVLGFPYQYSCSNGKLNITH